MNKKTSMTLADIARLHVGDVMQLEVPAIEPDVATPEQWAQQTLEAYRPLFTELATSLGGTDELPADVADDPMACVALGAGRALDNYALIRRTLPAINV